MRHGLSAVCLWALVTSVPVAATGLPASHHCVVEISVVDAGGVAPQAPLLIRLVDGAGVLHEVELLAGESMTTIEDTACGPSTVEVILQPNPQKWTEDKPLRLARRLFDFTKEYRATVNLRIPSIRRVPCKVVDTKGQVVAGGTVGATGFEGDPVSTLSIGARIGVDGSGELLLTVGEHKFTYGDSENFLQRPSKANGRSMETDVVIVGDDETRIEFVVPRHTPKAILKGRVVDPEGNGIEGVVIEKGRRRDEVGTTDGDGAFESSVAKGARALSLRAKDREARWIFQPQTIEIGTEDLVRVTIVGEPWPGPRVRGRVVEGDTGQPVVEAHLMADMDCLEESPVGFLSLETDDDGRFDIPCSGGCPAEIRVYPYWSQSPEYFSEDAVEVPLNACDSEWTLFLERGRVLAGRIVDQNGHGVSRLPLMLVRQPDQRQHEWTTAADGSYAFRPLLPGRYSLGLAEYRTWGTDRYLFLAEKGALNEPIHLIDIQANVDVQKDLVAVEGGLLCVRGVKQPHDDAVSPITGLHVVPATADDSRIWSGRVHELLWNRSPEGGCTLGLPPGDWRFLAGADLREQVLVAPAWTPGQTAAGSPSYEVVRGQRTHVQALTGQPTGWTIIRLPGSDLFSTSTVRIDVAFDPPENIGEPTWHPVPRERFGLFADSGGYNLWASLPPGEYHLRVRVDPAGDVPSRTWRSDSMVDVMDSEQVETTLVRFTEQDLQD